MKITLAILIAGLVSGCYGGYGYNGYGYAQPYNYGYAQPYNYGYAQPYNYGGPSCTCHCHQLSSETTEATAATDTEAVTVTAGLTITNVPTPGLIIGPTTEVGGR